MHPPVLRSYRGQPMLRRLSECMVPALLVLALPLAAEDSTCLPESFDRGETSAHTEFATTLGELTRSPDGPERLAKLDTLLAPADTGRLIGFVREGETGPGIAQAIVTVTGPTERSGVANNDGYFRFELLPVGRYTVRAEHLAYATVEGEVEVVGNNQTTRAEIRLLPQAIPLEPIIVTVEGVRPTFGPLVQVYERVDHQRRLGLGRILTRDDLERRVAQRLSHILQTMPGVRIQRDSLQNYQARMTGRANIPGQPCWAELFIDGMRVPTMGASIDDFVRVNEIEVLEVYRGAAQIPAEYARGGVQCGVVAVWTRRGW